MSACRGCFALKKKRINIFVNKIKCGSLFLKLGHFTIPQFFFFQIKLLVCFIFLYKFWLLQSPKTDPELIHDYESPKSKKTQKFWRETILVTFLVVIHFFQNLPTFEKHYFMRHLILSYLISLLALKYNYSWWKHSVFKRRNFWSHYRLLQ